MEIVAGLIIILAAIVIGMTPTFIASHRKHNNTMAIGICNVVGLFTGVLWVVALIWAFTDNVKSK
ncbi:hypothetical protein phiV208_22 [Vibrio phage phiV208]|nr:hypothetical protein phiV208_22 [Vibrio phage phiV208]